MNLSETLLDYSILAESLRNPDAIPYFKEHLIEDAVGKVNNSYGVYQLYKNIVNCYNEIGEANFDTFGIWIESYPDLFDKLGGKESYNKLVGILKDVEVITPHTLTKLANRAYHRSMILSGMESLRNTITDDQADFTEVEELYEKIQERIARARGRQDICLRTALDIAETAEELWTVVPFIPTQYKSLNKELGYDSDLGGVMRGNIYSIVATSGLGKSTLAKSLCNNWLDQGMKVLFVNFEEAKDHWERVLMTQVTGENVYKGFKKDSVEIAKLTEIFKTKMREWGTRFMVRHDPDSLYFEDLELWLRDLYDHQEGDRPDIVVIDTIQSLFTKSGGKARWGEFEQIMVRLEKLAKDMNAVFILTAQQNSNALKENRSEMNQGDIGGGVTIVQKSSVVMLMVPRKTDIDIDSYSSDAATPIMEIHTIKNRITGAKSGRNPPLIRYDDDLKLYENYDLSRDIQATTDLLNDFGEIDPTLGI